MALKKEIIFNNGVNIKYHYINDIQIDGKNKIAKFIVDSENQLVQVLVRHYAEKEYRDSEKETAKLNTEFKDKYERLNKLVDENLPETVQERIELTNYINEIQEVRDNEPSMVIYDSNEVLDFYPDANYSLKGVYEQLGKLEKYKDSEAI